MTETFRERETDRLRIRLIRPNDWQAIHAYMSDPDIMAWLPEGTLDERRVQAFAQKNAGGVFDALAVIEKGSGELIGHMVFQPWQVSRTHEIGWIFAARYHGAGYATEAARSLIAHAFEDLRCHRIIATCQPENPASWRVMEKLGMRREGHFRACIPRLTGEWWDEYFYAILADEYFDECDRKPT